MDPYSRNEWFLLTFMQNIYEPLVRRDRSLAIEPALATSWQRIDPLTWRFHLRRGVSFQEGEPFTADDVIFSYARANAPGSQTRGFFSSIATIRKIDDHTVDIKTAVPDPILLDELTLWVIMNPELDALIGQIAVETTPGRRDAEILQASQILHGDAAFLPLHQQSETWAARANIDLVQPADNSFPLRYVTVH